MSESTRVACTEPGNRDRYSEPIEDDDEPMTAASRAGALLRKFDEGMSTRAIAPIVGATKSQVDRDVRATVPNGADDRPAKVTSLDGRERPANAKTIRVDANTGETIRTPEEIRAHCDELRALLADARARREVQP